MDWTAEAEEVRQSLEEDSQPVTLTREVPGEYDPDLGAAPTVTETAGAVGLAFDYSLLQPNAGAAFASGLILEGDRQLLMSVPAEFLPAPGYMVTLVDGLWLVKNVKAVAPAGVPVLYDLHLRRP